MEKLDLLKVKVNNLIIQVVKLKQEREKLISEKKYSEGEDKRAKKVLAENETYRTERKLIKDKIERILGKFSEMQV